MVQAGPADLDERFWCVGPGVPPGGGPGRQGCMPHQPVARCPGNRFRGTLFGRLGVATEEILTRRSGGRGVAFWPRRKSPKREPLHFGFEEASSCRIMHTVCVSQSPPAIPKAGGDTLLYPTPTPPTIGLCAVSPPIGDANELMLPGWSNRRNGCAE